MFLREIPCKGLDDSSLMGSIRGLNFVLIYYLYGEASSVGMQMLFPNPVASGDADSCSRQSITIPGTDLLYVPYCRCIHTVQVVYLGTECIMPPVQPSALGRGESAHAHKSSCRKSPVAYRLPTQEMLGGEHKATKQVLV